jgi:hypothetical protein
MGSLGAGHYFTGRGARCLAMTEIKLGRTPHSALSIPHLNGSFPEFILGWTTGANLVLTLALTFYPLVSEFPSNLVWK